MRFDEVKDVPSFLVLFGIKTIDIPRGDFEVLDVRIGETFNVARRFIIIRGLTFAAFQGGEWENRAHL